MIESNDYPPGLLDHRPDHSYRGRWRPLGKAAGHRVFHDLVFELVPRHHVVQEATSHHLSHRERAAGEDHFLKLPQAHGLDLGPQARPPADIAEGSMAEEGITAFAVHLDLLLRQVEDVPMNALSHDPKILWHYHPGEGPTVGLAVHAGHEIRAELLPYLAIDEPTRIREEDPYTDYWTLACDHQIVTRRSRFEVDLNRPPPEAICVQPADCWNLHVWRETLPDALMERSLAEHAAFYTMLRSVLADIEQRHGRFVVYDIHSYNHRRHGPLENAADPSANPDINIGTGTMNRDYWAPVVDRLVGELRSFDFLGRNLDVRENVNFKGRQIAQFVHETFPRTGCAIAIEVKKFFMDEWTGIGFPEQINAMRDAFAATVPGATEELSRL